MIYALRGMKDILPPESKKFSYLIFVASKIAENYGFEFIATPILEETALFKRSVGESSDIVGKEMYQFIDKGGNDVCLRPEGTAGVVRSFIEAKLDRTAGVHRFYYYGPMFRYERPQKGRLRQFHQFGCETFGEGSVYEDANMILLVRQILESLGIPFKLKINSLGCPKCMPFFKEKLINSLQKIASKLCEDCNRRIQTNPLRVFDCKNESCQKELESAPKLLEYLCDDCRKDLEVLTKTLDANGLVYEIDPHLVRGLDYYTKTAFEFTSTHLGAQNAVAGGGRFDRLVEFLDGKPTPAIGFAIGIERILDLITLPNEPREGIYMGVLQEDGLERLLKKAAILRKNERVVLEYAAKSLKSHLKAADKTKARLCAIIGEEELKNGTIWIKNLETKEEKTLSLGDFEG